LGKGRDEKGAFFSLCEKNPKQGMRAKKNDAMKQAKKEK
jgi:hypothetical protein